MAYWIELDPLKVLNSQCLEVGLIIKKLEVGPIMANCFIVACEKTKQAVVIDPGDDADRILMALSKSELTVKYLILRRCFIGNRCMVVAK